MGVLRRAGAIPFAVLGIVLFFLPLIGLLFFLLVAVAGGIVTFSAITHGAEPQVAWNILQYGWKLYIGLVLVTLFFMTTFSYTECCVGLNSFWQHLLHARGKHIENIVVALGWPYTWLVVDANLKGWGLNWLYILERTLEYWLVTIRKGIKFEYWNLRKGTVTADRVKPESASEVLRYVSRDVLNKEEEAK